ncbi:MAG: hypothetical protein JKY42_04840, partial [Flavobacteriales bacterium]|nr:hypothetical protein [Flavobacteriales bacterium]
MKIDRLLIITFATILILVVYSCQKEKSSIDFYFDQTLCSDPWNTGQNDSELEIENSVKGYLKDQNIKVHDIEIDHHGDLTFVCEACHCLSGTKIIVSVDKKKIFKMKSIGLKNCKNDCLTRTKNALKRSLSKRRWQQLKIGPVIAAFDYMKK